MTIHDILARAGGPRAISDATRKMGPGYFRTHWAVHKWSVNGIPARYLGLIAKRAKVSLECVLDANEAVIRPLARRSRAEVRSAA
jgi:hypothetical protein